MASLPPRPASQRRSSSHEQSSSDGSHGRIPRTNSEAYSTISEDSQTVLLNRPSSPPAEAPQSNEALSQTSQPTAQADSSEPRKCWICFNDETEDTPLSSEWRSPCPCALTAHEQCLLDWIADMEAPNSRRRSGSSAKILCPQCKSEIHLARPRSYIVDVVRAIERVTGKLVLPGVLFVGGYMIYSAAYMHGASTIYALFGAEDAYRILGPSYELPEDIYDSLTLNTLFHNMRHWRLTAGLPLIPTMLILSRTTFADSVLPIPPMVFFVTTTSSEEILDIGHWPPSAALSFAILPYLRSAYNAYYEKVWGERERRWLKEIQPRSTGEDGNENEDGDLLLDNAENILEINVDVGIVDEWEENEHQHHQHLHHQHQHQQQQQQEQGAGGIARPLNAPPPDAAADDAAPPAQEPPNPAPAPRQNNNIILSTSRLADTILGALVFPYIASGVGELLRLTLPRAWTKAAAAAGAGAKPAGILQTRWGRSIVGGCLFVGLKDAVMLYVRWRMARDHRMRRVLDFDKARGRVVDPGR